MRFRFSQFVVSVSNFCEDKYYKIKVIFITRVTLFHYRVYFVRLS
jgi:hypothetical protein